MFTKHIPRTGKPVGNSSAFTRIGATIGVIALGSGFALAAPLSASADTVMTSYAEGQFLSGTLAGTDLANIAALAPAQAQNDGTQSMQWSKDPLGVDVLTAQLINAPQGWQMSLGDFLDAGVVSQYAQADKNGQAMGTSGAAQDGGGVGLGDTEAGQPDGDLNLDLNQLLDSQYAMILKDLKLSLTGISGTATANGEEAWGDYTLADAILSFNSPAVADLTPKVNTALDTVDSALSHLGGTDGVVGQAVNRVLNPVLSVVGSSADVTADVTTDLKAAVDPLLTGDYGNGAVHFNLQTGDVRVDLAALLGGDLNNLPANTELLNDGVINSVLDGITSTVATLSDQIIDKVRIALNEAHVTVHAGLDLLTPQAASQSQVCHDIQIPIIGDLVNSITGGITNPTNGLLGNLLGTVTGGTNPATGALQGIIGYTTQTVCDLVDNLLPDLHSTVNVDLDGTVRQLIDGQADKSDASISLLGGTVNAAIDINGILSGVGTALTDGLFDNDGAVQQLVESLNSGLVHPATEGLFGDTSVSHVLTDILSVRVNVQEIQLASERGAAINGNSYFSETAVRVAMLKGAGTSLATLNAGQGTVGPNAKRVVPPPTCTTNCTPDPDPCTVNCGGGGNTPTALSHLAMTGVGIATLIAVILALLAAGAYLAREGYRRNHPHSLT